MKTFKPGTTLQGGRYRIDAVLGQGGFGITYLGEHTMLRKKVAIKEFFPTNYCSRDTGTNMLTAYSPSSDDFFAKYRRKFQKEAITLSRLKHPNIVTSVDIFEENNTVYYVMDFIDGRSLQQMTHQGPLDPADALRYIRKIGEALSYLHSQQIMHLDVKPANIMINKANDEPILIDFGLAKNYSPDNQDSTNSGIVGLTKGYSPLEQYSGDITGFTPKTDIYALGATLYRLLTGQTPPEPSHLLNEGFPALPATVPPSIIGPMQKAMAVIRRDRYNTVREFLQALPESLAASALPPTAGPGLPPPTAGPNLPPPPIGPGPTSRPISEPMPKPEPKPAPAPKPKPAPKPVPGPKFGLKIWQVIVLAFVLGFVALIVIGMVAGDDTDDQPVPNDSTAVLTKNVENFIQVTDIDIQIDSLHYRYTGSVRSADSIPEGSGAAEFIDNAEKKYYRGEFKNGRLNGDGEVIYQNGDRFVGSLISNHLDSGTYTLNDGNYYFTGSFVNDDTFDGTWYNNGTKFSQIVKGKEKRF